MVIHARMQRASVRVVDTLCAHDGRTSNEQGRRDRSHSEIAHRIPQRQYPALAVVACLHVRRRPPVDVKRRMAPTLIGRRVPSLDRSANSSVRSVAHAFLVSRSSFGARRARCAHDVAGARRAGDCRAGGAGRTSLSDQPGDGAASNVARHENDEDNIEGKVDGRIDEAAWNAAEPLTDFVQQLPSTGAIATYPTVVRVLYDSEQLYVSAICFQKKGDTTSWRASSVISTPATATFCTRH